MSLKLPTVIGHRGACGYAPENTLESIKTAASLGVKWVELDVKLTRDSIPIIFHDDDLSRTTNGSGLVAETSYDYIRNLEAGSWFSGGFAGIKIPTLEEALDIILEHNLGLNLEIKPCAGREKETAEVALDHRSRIWDDHDNLLISSFHPVSLEAAMDIAGDWHRGLLLEDSENAKQSWRDMADYLSVSTINASADMISSDFAAQIMDAELSLLVYTVNDPVEARRLQRLGADGFFSDTPDVLLENLPKDKHH